MRRTTRCRESWGARAGRRTEPRAALLLALSLLIGNAPVAATAQSTTEESAWLRVEYGGLLDLRQPSHSGDSVGDLLRGLAARGTTDAPDPVTLSLLDPLIEPYAFVLQDLLDSLGPMADPPMLEVGPLWIPGQAQPAWAELLRARRYLVESDGIGRMRVLLPWTGAGPLEEAATGKGLRAEVAAAWPVLRHVFAAERRRLARSASAGPDARPLRVEFRVYRHDVGRSAFFLSAEKLEVALADTRPSGRRTPLDLESSQGFLDRGLQLEGARLGPGGTLELLGSPRERTPTLLGRPLELSDFAVAYRAVFHGGHAEPYMSLDRGWSPQTAIVNYGGRLRDTAPGLVSLLCDIRFKTFSLGLGIAEGRDLRGEIRGEVPSFRSHLERFAFDAQSRGVMTQQTRLWFYPDSVDLTVSPQGDLLAFRRVRMTASSERVADPLRPGAMAGDPPWTRDTVEAVNRDYDRLARIFPELADLDQVVRLLSLFTWLKQAEADGLPVPELDVLLALELPPLPTPRTYPQLLSLNALPPAGREGDVLAFDRVPLGAALDRLDPASGRPLPARLRLERAMAALDPRDEESAALLAELRDTDLGGMDESQLDRQTYRVERLRMHRLVLSTLDPARRAEVSRRWPEEEAPPRIFSVGIGGLDLGMTQAVNRARGRSLQLVSVAPGWSSGTTGGAAATPVAARSGGRPEVADEPREEWRLDSALLPALALPDHGPRAVVGEAGSSKEFGGHRIEWGVESGSGPGAAATRWLRVIFGADGPEAQSRRVWLDDGGTVLEIERLREGRLIRYRFEGGGGRWTAVSAAPRPTPATPRAEPSAALPEGLAMLSVVPAARSAPRLRLRGAGPAGSRPLEAEFPSLLLQRVVLGREADLTPGRPLPGLDPLPEALGQVRTLMVLAAGEQRRAPWEAMSAGPAGEEDPIRLARALGAWWTDPGTGVVRQGSVVGTDPERSVERWRAAPSAKGPALLLLPEEGFPGPSASLRDRLAASWSAGPVAGALAAKPDAGLIVVVSAEAPGLFAARLRDLARRPELRGKLLAAWCLSGPVRQDLPGSLLDEGNLAAFGLAESTLVNGREVAARLDSLGRSLARSPNGDRVERLAGPFLWFF